MAASIIAYSPDFFSDSGHLERAAELIYLSFEEFYYLFSERIDYIITSLKNQLLSPNSEISDGIILVENYNIIGINAFYPISEIKKRQYISIRELLKIPKLKPDVYAKLDLFRKKVEPITLDCIYLARIAVSSKFQGCGYGSVLVEGLEENVRKISSSTDKAMNVRYKFVSTHVKKNNAPSHVLFKKLGYRYISNKEFQHRALIKELVWK